MDTASDKRTQLLGNASVPSAITKLAVPAIVSMVIMAVYNMADTYFVSLMSTGDLEVAAVSVFMPIMLIMQSVAVLFAAGGAALLSRQLGEGEKQRAGNTAAITLTLAFCFGIIVMVAGLLFAKPLLMVFGASEATVDHALDYAMVLFIAAPVQLTNMAFNNLLRAEGNSLRSMVGIVTGAALNMILDPIFIFTFGMGVMGAALATAISQLAAFIILGSNYWTKMTVVKVSIREMKFDSATVKYILKIGVSNFLIQIFTAVSFAVINICTKVYGDGAIAAIGIVNRLQFFGFAVLFGFSQGFQPVAGYNFGANKFTRLRTALVFGISVALSIGVVIMLLFRVFDTQLVGIFTQDENVLRLGEAALKWFTAALPITAFSLIVMMMYQALGKAGGALVLAICRQGVCLIPAVLVLADMMGFQGILISPLIADAISGVIALALVVSLFKYIRESKERYEKGVLWPDIV